MLNSSYNMLVALSFCTERLQFFQLIPVLLSTFGVVLRGIDSGYYYPRPKIPFPDSICPPRTTGTFPYCEEFPTHLDCDEGKFI